MGARENVKESVFKKRETEKLKEDNKNGCKFKR